MTHNNDLTLALLALEALDQLKREDPTAFHRMSTTEAIRAAQRAAQRGRRTIRTRHTNKQT